MGYNSWKDLFSWLFIMGANEQLLLEKSPSGYLISCDGISYFRISKRMAKKVSKEFCIEVKMYG